MFDIDQMAFYGRSFESLPDLIKNAFLFANHLNINSESEQTEIISYNIYDWRRFFKAKYIRTVFEDGKTGLTIFVEDVTLEKDMEEQLRLNEARFRGIVEDQTELICRYSCEGNISFVNGAFSRLLKISSSNINISTFFDLFPDSMHEFIRDKMKICSKEKPVFELESEMIMQSGELRWFHWISRALFGNTDNIVEFQGVGRDITERKDNEREILIKSHAIDSSIMPILLTSLDGMITYVNSAFLNLWKYQYPEDVIGLSLEQFTNISILNLSDILGIYKQKPGDGFSGNVSGSKNDGTIIHLSVTISTVYDTDGKPICLIAYFSDITDQVRMIRELEIRNTAIDHSYEGMAIVTQDNIIAYANPSFIRLFNRVPDGAIIGRTLESCMNFYPQIFGSLPDIKETLLEKGNFTKIFSDTKEKGSKWIIQMHMSRAYDNNGKHICTLISVLDITDQKTIEESLALTIDQLEGTVEQIRDPTFIISIDRIVVAWNYAMETFSGIRKEMMIGSSRYKEIISGTMPSLPILVDLFHLSPKELIQSFPKVSKVGNTYYTEAYIPGINRGNSTYLWVRASPIVDASGKAIGIMQTIKDMTNWKRAAESTIEQ